MDAFTPSSGEEVVTSLGPSLENLPLECIQVILEYLSNDCHALYSLLLMNKTWFQMVLPFLYRSPMALVDATWPKLSAYSQVLKKGPSSLTPQSPLLSPIPVEVQGANAGTVGETRSRSVSRNTTSESSTTSDGTATESVRSGRSQSNTRRTSTISSSNGGYGLGYAPRTHSRSSSHSSTRSWTGDAFHQGRNEAVLQKDQREKLVKRKKMQLLWVLLNCTLSEEEYEASVTMNAASSKTASDNDTEKDKAAAAVWASSTLLSQKLGLNLEIETEYFRPMVDYLAHYTHLHHPGLRLIIWKVFPSIDDAFRIEWRLLSHSPERIRELYLESVELQDMIPLIPKLEKLQRIKACCQEDWDVSGPIEFMKQHNKLFGTVRMMELEGYLPDKHETPMDERFSDLISQVEHLKVLELTGFESLKARLNTIPYKSLKVLKLNCGTLKPEYTPYTSITEEQQQHGLAGQTTGSSSGQDGRMPVSSFLSQCRQLEELLLDPVDEDVLEWAVQERRDFEAALLTSNLSSSSAIISTHNSPPTLIPLKILELSGEDSERVAMTVSQAAEAFQDTLEVIKANSYSYRYNRLLTPLSWRCLMPRLQVLKVVGRSNLPLDFQSFQYCPSLRILDLSKYSGMRACSEAALLNLKYLTKLEYLGLSSFDHLTDSTLRTILGCMPRLKHLRLAIGDSSTSSSAGGTLSTTTISSFMNPASSGTIKNTGSTRASGAFGSSAGTGTNGGGNSNSNSNGSGSGSGSGSASVSVSSTTNGNGGGIDLLKSPFASLSISSSSASSPVSNSLTASPVSQYVYSPYSHHHTPPPLPHSSSSFSTTISSPYLMNTTSTSSLVGSINSNSGGGVGDMASSAWSTSSLMDRFHLENNFLSLEGILDAIDGLSDSKDQLEKLSIVLGKLDFEDHYRRLEQYNQLHPDLEITVYRYAHAV
ncbi:hypothetical protein BX616_005065 [Lobosporangium transversale]|nr:hypothetical protein BX616_005065 [Lobosporangium transversale]